MTTRHAMLYIRTAGGAMIMAKNRVQFQKGYSLFEFMQDSGAKEQCEKALLAWMMKHKLLQAMKETDDRHPIGGIIQLDDVYWGGERRGGKRGRVQQPRRPS